MVIYEKSETSSVPLLRDGIAPLTLELHSIRAMEFAFNRLGQYVEADDSWLPNGSRSFFVSGAAARLERFCDSF